MKNGEELFQKYTLKSDEYAQMLYTARLIVANDESFFKTLEKAEKEGKKIALVEQSEKIVGEYSKIKLVNP